jgi:hypothetical protein
MAKDKPKPLQRDISRFRKFAPEPRAHVRPNPDKTLGYISTLELIHNG